ncbi:hypothetical protein M011DRAFT_258063 [Sporormia fimetaria CBS 119925]|uniref:Uncharacterized protein n=1 Tax=Sporormia fimetaria CBS 119925 TaxID=1340428 RepID=A0A6A6UZG0_9PLEO|nr:hypothetical protein M011DRAFT_258063 [Sporormia fimetaria CBS 119925]
MRYVRQRLLCLVRECIELCFLQMIISVVCRHPPRARCSVFVSTPLSAPLTSKSAHCLPHCFDGRVIHAYLPNPSPLSPGHSNGPCTPRKAAIKLRPSHVFLSLSLANNSQSLDARTTDQPFRRGWRADECNPRSTSSWMQSCGLATIHACIALGCPRRSRRDIRAFCLGTGAECLWWSEGNLVVRPNKYLSLLTLFCESNSLEGNKFPSCARSEL